MFIKNDMIDKLKTNVDEHKRTVAKADELVEIIEEAKDEIKRIDIELTKEEEELFDGITDEELVEFAAMAQLHGMVTQEVSTLVASGKPVNKELNLAVSKKVPTKGPRRAHLHLDDEDIDLDVPMLMNALEDDTEQIFFVKIHNITLEKYILYGIFDKLKSTQSMKHLALTNVGLNDEKLLTLVEILKQNETIETLNLESNVFTNHACEPLLEMLVTHPSIREIKLSHQKYSLGTRGEEAMARLITTNTNMMKIGYGFSIAACRSSVDRAMIRNQEAERQKRARGEPYYNYPEEIKRRNAHPQPWIRTQEARTEKMKLKIAQQKVRMKCIPNIGVMRAMARAYSCAECVAGNCIHQG
jgi:tropomodulin